jgi:hypothetical protein
VGSEHATVRSVVPSELCGPAPSSRNAALTRTAYVVQGEVAFSEWIQHGRQLGAIGRSAGWWIGDWLGYGNARYGDRYSRASRITGYDTQTLMNMVYVASRFSLERRRAGLSWSHHAELAAMPPEDQDRWLSRAEADRLSVRCLREEIRRERRAIEAAKQGQLPAGNGSGDAASPADGNGAAVAEGTVTEHHGSDLAALLPHLVELRELRDVVVERPLVPGDAVRISVRVDAAAPLTEERELLSISANVVNDAGETVVRANADVVCRDARDRAPQDEDATIAGTLNDVDIEQIPV